LDFIDETGFMLQPLVRRTWAKRGQTPLLKAWDRHDRMTAITALVLEPHRTTRKFRMYFQLQRRNANHETLFWFLVHLRRELKNPLVVIWDRLGAHRKAERHFAKLEIPGISFESLPAYCPKLNPIEHVWSTTKYGRLANWPAPSITELETRLQQEFNQQKTEQQLLRGHFEWAGLSLE
jgi:transposase